MRVAIFGSGYWAAFQVAAWQARGADIAALWNRTRTRADNFAKQYGIPRVFDSAEALFRWGEFDIADIITDVQAHEELVLMAAAYGKPVICQKPMAETLESCHRMVNACAEAGVWFAVHENFRYQPPTSAFVRAVRSGDIGRLVRAELNMRSPDLDIMAKQPALSAMPHMVLRDMGPHMFDVARAAFGEMASIYAVPIHSYPEQVSVPDAAVCTLIAESGCVLSCNLVHEWNDRFVAIGERGSVRLDHDNVLHICAGGQQRILDTKTWPMLSYINCEDWHLHGGHVMSAIPECIDQLVSAYEAGAPAPTSGMDNLRTMEILFAAIRSFDSGMVEKTVLEG